jgi:hypothetical protein
MALAAMIGRPESHGFHGDQTLQFGRATHDEEICQTIQSW